MIRVWIRYDLNGACWRRLLEVVAASYGGQDPALAQNLAKEHSISEGEASICLKASTLKKQMIVQWNISYPNVSGPKPVHNSENSVSLKLRH